MDVKAIPAAALPLRELPLTNSLKIREGAADKEHVAVKKAAREFESMFVGMMLKSMRETVGKDNLTGGGRGEETFRSLLDQEYAQQAAQRGNLGISTMIERELTRRSPDPKGGSSAD